MEARAVWGLADHSFYSIPYDITTLPSPELFGDTVNYPELNTAGSYEPGHGCLSHSPEIDRPVMEGRSGQDSLVFPVTLLRVLFGTITKFPIGRTPGTHGPDPRLVLGFET